MYSNNPVTRKRQRRARKLRAKNERYRQRQRSTIRGRMCKTKRAYSTEGDALVAICVGQRRGVALRSYLCPFCNKYHLSSIVDTMEG